MEPDNEPAEETPDEQPAPEKEPEPEVTEDMVRGAFEELIKSSPMGAKASVEIVEFFKDARDENGLPKLSALKPADYVKAYDLATAKAKQLADAGTGGVL